jgi:phosphoglycolate phosphatase (TIGR01487 family)
MSVDSDVPPLVVDIDGTLTDEDRAVDPRVFPVLREWPKRVVVATGKAMPYPIALCEFLGIERSVVAENGGVVFVEATDRLRLAGDDEAARAVTDAYRALGHDLGFGDVDLANRWRETEIAINLDRPRGPLDEIAAEHGLEVVDTGYAYHVKDPAMSKGRALQVVADEIGLRPDDFLAVGDSPNDISTFEIAGEAVAVANAETTAKAAADWVTERRCTDGFLEAIGVDPDGVLAGNNQS